VPPFASRESEREFTIVLIKKPQGKKSYKKPHLHSSELISKEPKFGQVKWAGFWPEVLLRFDI
jgi:hypothetical protein